MEKTGFDYYIEEEILKDYQKKSLKLRLKWLYYGNKFRQKYPKDSRELGTDSSLFRGKFRGKNGELSGS
jgi:hypothetical protein